MNRNLYKGRHIKSCSRASCRFVFVLLGLSIAATSTSIAYAQFGSAKVKLLGGIPGAQVRVNGRSIGTLPLQHAATVDPGRVEIEVEKEGFETFRHSFTIASGERERVWIDLESYPDESNDELAVTSPLLTGVDADAAKPSYARDAATSNTHPASVYALLDQSKAPSSSETDTFDDGKDPSPISPAPTKTDNPYVSNTTDSTRKLNEPPAGQIRRATNPLHTAPKAPIRKEETLAANKQVSPNTTQSNEPFVGLQNNSERSFDDQGEKENEEEDIFDPLLFEVFSGYSYLLLALGTRPVPDYEEVANLSEQEAQELASTGIEDWVDVAQGGGATVGTALSLRIDFISFGARLSYSTYGEADVLVFMGEIAQRIQGSVAEFYAGFGFGGGWLYRVPDERITQDSGLAVRLGLGLSFFIARGWTIGIGADAIGLFLGGNGVSPSQVSDFSPTEVNHPVGLQVPITLNISPRL